MNLWRGKEIKFASGNCPLYTSIATNLYRQLLEALPALAGPADQVELIKLLAATDKPDPSALREAIVSAAKQINDPEKDHLKF